DSLMGVELAAALEARFGIKISVMALSENPTIEKLAERINALLRGSVEDAGVSDEGTVLSQVQRVASQHAADVSADAMVQIAADLQTQSAPADRRLIH
ncbi:MAG: acyl carrier protein, partial [Gammaproteobacteria bacterium]|nr:acyl carrier protein [Gammaproteobacteria bacterium]